MRYDDPNIYKFGKPIIEAGMGDFDVQGQLGEGTQAVVLGAVYRATGSPVALKVAHDPRTTETEYLLLRDLDNPHVARPLFRSPPGDGTTFLGFPPLAPIEPAKPETLLRVMRELAGVAEGLDYVHSLGVLHCDVKPANMMIDDDGQGVLIDFGQGCRVDQPATPFPGSLMYMAPEVAARQPASEWSDRYSFALAAHVLMFGRYPNVRDPEAFSRLPSTFQRALAPEPTARYNWAATFMMELASEIDPSSL